MCDGSGATSWTHDQMGRIWSQSRTIGAVTDQTVGYNYNLDGSVASISYPSGRVLNYTYNGAQRALAAIDPSTANYVTTARYTPPGPLAAANNGTGILTANSYNNRLQPVTLAAVAGSQLVFSLNYNFHWGAGDNGNVYNITNNRPNDSYRSQHFSYDALNRVQQAWSSGGSGNAPWGESYTTDIWANLTNISSISSSCQTAEGLSVGTALKNNQLPSFSYDIAGNLLGSAQYSYDVGDRISTTSSGYTYVYDGEAQRVEKSSSGTGTLYWTGAGGEVLAESDLSANFTAECIFFNGQRVARRDSAGNVHYYFSDHLGSHDVVTNAAGVCEQDIDFYPYGGIYYDYCNTQVPQHYKFTGKERDAETGLDYFGARHLASSMGRWMSPDPTMVSVNGHNPQSWNRYAYVLNSPLKLLDPNGLWDLHYNDVEDKKHKHHVTVTAKPTPGKKGEDAARLADQLGLKGKAKEKFIEKVGTSTDVQLSKMGGRVGDVYSAVEEGLTAQANYTGKNGGPEGRDCSRTAAEIGYGQSFLGAMSTTDLDSRLGRLATPVAQADALVGDIVRYADASNVPQHFTTFIFTDDSGIPLVFSKGGGNGPYMTGSAGNFEGPQGPTVDYGGIKGLKSSDSGYYRPF
jgi:RHS repeat-associated protein